MMNEKNQSQLSEFLCDTVPLQTESLNNNSFHKNNKQNSTFMKNINSVHNDNEEVVDILSCSQSTRTLQ